MTRQQGSLDSKKLFFKTVIFDINIVSQNKSHLKKIKKALELIRDTDDSLFKKVLRLKAILVFHGKDYYGVVFEKQRVYIDQPKAIKDSSVEFLASSIIHEAWHIDQYTRGTRKFDGRAERGAYLIQKKFLMKVRRKFEIKWLDREYKLKWWQPEDTFDKKSSGYDRTNVDKKGIDFWLFFKKYQTNKLKIRTI
jgi:hypothetical protein